MCAYVKNQKLIDWVQRVAALTKPDRIECVTERRRNDRLSQQMVDAGTLKRLNPPNGRIPISPAQTRPTSRV